jgi:hypothetical protein
VRCKLWIQNSYLTRKFWKYENEDAHPKRTARKKATAGRRLNIADDDVAEA